MRRLVALLSLSLVLVLPADAAEDRIDGFAGYRFGMTLAAARSVRTDFELTDCEYLSVWKCIEFREVFYGEDAEVAVQFDSKSRLLDQIVVSFDRLKSATKNACSQVVKKVVPQLEARYGGNPTVMKPGEAIWYLARGGKVAFSNFCIDDDSGMVIVSYGPASSL